MYFDSTFSSFLLTHIYLLRLVHVMLIHRMHTLRLTFWGDFAEIEGAHLHRHLHYENILLAYRVHVTTFEGTIAIQLAIPF